MQVSSNRRYAIVTLGIALVIVYGSLYPFDFLLPAAGPGPVQMLIGSWANRPGRGDFLANILLYGPLGFFGALALSQRAGLMSRFLRTVLLGTLLSVALELAQYYDISRETAASDVYANGLGTALGAIPAIVSKGRIRWAPVHQIAANPIPALLLSAWIGYRLYPFVPTIDLHKYWNALKPLILSPKLSAYDLFGRTAIWLVVYALVARIGATLRPRLLIPLFAAGLLFAKVLVVSATLSPAEVAGAIVAYLVWIAFRPLPRASLCITIVMFSLAVVAQRLEPFNFTAHSVPFGWIPFRSFMYGSIRVDVLSFLEKFFLYGSLIWLLTEANVRRPAAAGLVTAMLFATSLAETHLPQRSAEVTDAVMALAIAAVFALVTNGHDSANARSDKLDNPGATPSPSVLKAAERPGLNS